MATLLNAAGAVDPLQIEQDPYALEAYGARNGEFGKGLNRAVGGTVGGVQALGGTALEAMGATSAGPAMTRRGLNTIQNAQTYNPAAVGEFTSIGEDGNYLGDAVDWATGSLGEAVPSIATALTGAGIGATVVSRVAGTAALKQALAVATTDAAKKALIKEIAAHELAGSVAGGAIGMFPQEAGEAAASYAADPEVMANTTAAERLGMAGLKGGANALLEAAVPAVSVNRIFGTAAKKVGKGEATKYIGTKAAEGFAGEALTEGTQQLVGDVAHNQLNPEHAAVDPKGILNSAMAGGVGGTVMTGGMGAIKAGTDRALDKTERVRKEPIAATMEAGGKAIAKVIGSAKLYADKLDGKADDAELDRLSAARDPRTAGINPDDNSPENNAQIAEWAALDDADRAETAKAHANKVIANPHSYSAEERAHAQKLLTPGSGASWQGYRKDMDATRQKQSRIQTLQDATDDLAQLGGKQSKQEPSTITPRTPTPLDDLVADQLSEHLIPKHVDKNSRLTQKQQDREHHLKLAEGVMRYVGSGFGSEISKTGEVTVPDSLVKAFASPTDAIEALTKTYDTLRAEGHIENDGVTRAKLAEAVREIKLFDALQGSTTGTVESKLLPTAKARIEKSIAAQVSRESTGKNNAEVKQRIWKEKMRELSSVVQRLAGADAAGQSAGASVVRPLRPSTGKSKSFPSQVIANDKALAEDYAALKSFFGDQTDFVIDAHAGAVTAKYGRSPSDMDPDDAQREADASADNAERDESEMVRENEDGTTEVVPSVRFTGYGKKHLPFDTNSEKGNDAFQTALAATGGKSKGVVDRWEEEHPGQVAHEDADLVGEALRGTSAETAPELKLKLNMAADVSDLSPKERKALLSYYNRQHRYIRNEDTDLDGLGAALKDLRTIKAKSDGKNGEFTTYRHGRLVLERSGGKAFETTTGQLIEVANQAAKTDGAAAVEGADATGASATYDRLLAGLSAVLTKDGTDFTGRVGWRTEPNGKVKFMEQGEKLPYEMSLFGVTVRQAEKRKAAEAKNDKAGTERLNDETDVIADYDEGPTDSADASALTQGPVTESIRREDPAGNAPIHRDEKGMAVGLGQDAMFGGFGGKAGATQVESIDTLRAMWKNGTPAERYIAKRLALIRKGNTPMVQPFIKQAEDGFVKEYAQQATEKATAEAKAAIKKAMDTGDHAAAVRLADGVFAALPAESTGGLQKTNTDATQRKQSRELFREAEAVFALPKQEFLSHYEASRKTEKETRDILTERSNLRDKKNPTLAESLRMAELDDQYNLVSLKNDPQNTLRDFKDSLIEEKSDLAELDDSDAAYVAARTLVIDDLLAKLDAFERKALATTQKPSASTAVAKQSRMEAAGNTVAQVNVELADYMKRAFGLDMQHVNGSVAEKLNLLARTAKLDMSKPASAELAEFISHMVAGSQYAGKISDAIKGTDYEARLQIDAKADDASLYGERMHNEVVRRAVRSLLEHGFNREYAKRAGMTTQLLEKLRAALKEFITFIGAKYPQIEKETLALVNQFMDGYATELTAIPKGFTQMDPRKLIAANRHAGAIIEAFATNRNFALTGSLSYAFEGEVWRKEDAGIHDLDFVTDLSPDVSEARMKRAFPNAVQTNKFPQRDAYGRLTSWVTTYVVPPKGVTMEGFTREAGEIKFRLEKDGKVVGSYVRNADGRETKTGIEAALVDFMMNTTDLASAKSVSIPSVLNAGGQADAKVRITEPSVSFRQKLMMGRPKDAKDFALFVPIGKQSKQDVQKADKQANAPLTAEEKAELQDDIIRRFGPDKIKLLLDRNLGGISGDYREDGVKRVIRAALGVMSAQGTVAHESMHGFFSDLAKNGSVKTRELLERVANNPIVLRKMERALDGHPEAIKQLQDPEERVAYMFQFYVEGKLSFGPEAEGFFEQVKQALIKIINHLRSRVTDEAMAQQIMEAFDLGRFQTSEAIGSLEQMLTTREEQMAAAGTFIEMASKVVGKTTFSAKGVMTMTKNPIVIGIAKRFDRSSWETTGGTSYFEGLQRQRDIHMNALNNLLQKHPKEDLALALKGLQSGKRPTDRVASQIFDAVHAHLEKMYRFMEDRKVQRRNEGNTAWEPIEHRAGYFPQAWDTELVLKGAVEFKEKLLTIHANELAAIAKQANQELAAGESAGPDTASAIAQIEGRTTVTAEDVADSIIQRLMSTGGMMEIVEGESSLGVSPLMRNVNRRTLNWLDKEAFNEFKQQDLVSILTGYTQQAVKRGEFTKAFGNGGEQISDEMDRATAHQIGGQALVDKVDAQFERDVDNWEAEPRGKYPTHPMALQKVLIKQHVPKDATAEQTTEGMAKVRAALDQADNELRAAKKAVMAMEGTLGRDIDPTLRSALAWATTYENWRLLTTSIFTSINDAAGIVVQGGEMADAWDAFVRGTREIKKTWLKDYSKDELTELAEAIGTVNASTALDALGQTYNSVFQPGASKKANDALFRFNGLEAWNRSMRVQATGVAIKYIEKLAAGKVKDSDRLIDELFGEGGKPVMKEDGTLDTNAEGNQVAILRWVNSAIITPNAAHRTTWMSDPHFALFGHLKSYTYSFHQTVLKRAYNEAAVHGNWSPALKIAMLYTPIMIAADAFKELLLPGDASWTKGGLVDYLSHGVSRAGLGGIPQMYAGGLYDQANAVFGDRASGDNGLFGLAGPVPNQVYNAVMPEVLGGGAWEQLGEGLAGALPGGTVLRRVERKFFEGGAE